MIFGALGIALATLYFAMQSAVENEQPFMRLIVSSRCGVAHDEYGKAYAAHCAQPVPKVLPNKFNMTTGNCFRTRYQIGNSFVPQEHCEFRVPTPTRIRISMRATSPIAFKVTFGGRSENLGGNLERPPSLGSDPDYYLIHKEQIVAFDDELKVDQPGRFLFTFTAEKFTTVTTVVLDIERLQP